MRVCVLIDAWEPIWGGGQTHVWEISRRLARKNYRVDIYTRALKNKKGKCFVQNERHIFGKLNIFRVGPCTQFFNFFGRVAWLLTVMVAITKEHIKQSYDIIHAHAYLAGIPGKLLSALLNRPVIFTVHGSNNLDLNKKGPVSFLEKVLLTKIPYNAEISVTEHFRKYTNKNKNVVVIPNGVDIHTFDGVKAKRKHKLLTVLWVGRFDRIKGIDILLRAFSKYVETNSKSILYLVGSGPEEKKMKKLAMNLNLGNAVKFFGKITQHKLPEIYKAADIFILPSLSEGFPLSVLEAWAAQLPVIATRVGDNTKLITQGRDGLLTPSGSVDSLYKNLLKLTDSEKRKTMGKIGYRKAKLLYTWDSAVEKLCKVYESII